MAEVHEYQSSHKMMSDVAGHTESSSLVYRRVHMLKAPLVRLLPCFSPLPCTHIRVPFPWNVKCDNYDRYDIGILVLCVHISPYSREETISSAQGVGALQTTTFHGQN